MDAGYLRRVALGAAVRAAHAIRRSRSIHVLLIALVVIAVLALAARRVFTDPYVWFSSVAVCVVLVLLAIATYDLIAELSRRLPYLLLDQRTPLPFAVRVLIVPTCLVSGIFLGHLYWH
jgi:hypothetical protein